MTLREKIISDLERDVSQKRREHIFSVEKEVLRICDIFGIEKEKEQMCLAALVHDITKEISFKEQLILCKKHGIILSCSDMCNPAVIHQKTAAYFALNVYGLEPFAADAVGCHATGKEKMTVFDMILCLADYTESRRTCEKLVELRVYFYDMLLRARTYEEKENALVRALIRSFDNTMVNLIEKNACIHEDSLKARNSLIMFKKEVVYYEP